MNQFINSFQHEIDNEPMDIAKRNFINKQFQTYRLIWKKYKNSKEVRRKYEEKIENARQTYTFFIEPTGETKQFKIEIDVSDVHHQLSHTSHTWLKIYEFEKLIEMDLKVSANSYNQIKSEIKYRIPHEYQNLILLNFEGAHMYLMDGKHRYFEYKKFSNDKIPVLTTSCFNVRDCIVNKRDFVIYMIYHNIIQLVQYVNNNIDKPSDLIEIEEI